MTNEQLRSYFRANQKIMEEARTLEAALPILEERKKLRLHHEAAAALNARAAKYRASISRAERLRDYAESLLACIEDPEVRLVARFRFVEGLKWEDVEKRLHESRIYMSRRSLVRRENMALDILRQVMDPGRLPGSAKCRLSPAGVSCPDVEGGGAE